MSVENKTLPFQGLSDHDGFQLQPQFAANVRNIRSLRQRIVRSPGGVLLAPPPVPSIGDPGYGARVGTFTKNVVTGNQTVTHGLGVTPKAIILVTSYNTTAATIQNNIQHSFGFTDLTTSRSISMYAKTGLAASNTSRRYANVLLTVVGLNETTVAECAYVSATSSTFTINWTTNDTTAAIVQFIVLGVAAMSAKVVEWTLTTGTGNVAVTGVGGLPQAVIHIYDNSSAAGSTAGGFFGLGAMTTTGQFATGAAIRDGRSLTESGRLYDITSAIGMTNANAPYNTDYRAKFVSMDADGFTVNKTNGPANALLVASLCLRGMSGAKIGTYTQPVGAMPSRESVTGVGFQPQMVLPITLRQDPSQIHSNDVGFAYGAADGTNQWATAFADDEDSSNTNDHSITETGQVITFLAETDVQVVSARASMFSLDSDGFTTQWTQVGAGGGYMEYPSSYLALKIGATSSASETGIPRNYPEVYVGPSGPAVDKYVMLTHKSAFIYTPSTSSTGVFGPTAEAYTGTQYQRFSIANTQGIAAWSQGVNNIREWDGTSFTGLITSGTNHAARALLAFADRIVSVRPFFGGVDHPTQIRWCVNGDVNDWTGDGSGALEIIETSQDPLVTGFVLGDRAYLAKRRELIELIWTGSLSPVFGTIPRVRGMGVLAPHSVGLAEQVAFWLGPDDIYMWDGSTLTAVGERVYNTITALIDYNNLDNIQGAVYTPDSLYYLVVPPYIFIYDYRRDTWYWDDIQDFAAIGIYQVGVNFTADIDKSQFIVVGSPNGQTVRVDFQATDWLGSPIDSYFETRDYTADDLVSQKPLFGGSAVDLWNLTSLREIRFQGPPGNVVEVGISLDRGTSWETTEVAMNDFGTGVAWFQRPFNQIRFRFRDFGTDSYEVRGSWAFDVEPSGYNIPAE